MQIPDLINGSFEFLGGFFVLNHCRVLYKHKSVSGVSILSTAFFTSWAIWNCYYYKHLDQILSWYGGMFIGLGNILYTIMLILYSKKVKFKLTET